MVRLVEDMTEDHPARPVLVISNDPDAAGLVKAGELGIATCVVDHKRFGRDRAAFEKALDAELTTSRPDIICLAGFMRILTAEFVGKWAGKIINIHPSLLPKYPGLNTHQRAIDAGDSEAGCTVHEVTSALDAGPILGQAKVPLIEGDTAQILATRVLKQEHKLYPEVLRRFALGDRTPVCLSPGPDQPINPERV